jgi:hypothetical protein
MLAGRWKEGMVPHVRYDARQLDGYSPGPDRWPRTRAHVAQAGQLTSGITNPPLLVTAALRTGRLQPDPARRQAFWRRCFAALRDWLGYLSTSRLLPAAPLVTVVHPWEGGWDNSPRWDHLREAGLKPLLRYARLDNREVEAADRPTDRDYDGYLALVELLDGVDYRLHEYRERSPFCVYDVLFDALFYRAALDLNQMAAELGEPLPLSPAWLGQFAAAFEQLHWDPELELYVDWDCVADSRIRRRTAAGLAALAGGAARPDRARRAWERYLREAGAALPVCTVPPSDPAFDATRYWRGPVWANVNWLVAEGIEKAGLAEDAAILRARTLEMVRREGFAEYFDPRDGTARGARDFSWTAALTLDLLAGERP